MSASPSTVPAVEAKLVELFKAAVDPTVTQVWDAPTSEERQLEENVYIGDVAGTRAFKVISATVQTNGRQETYTVTVKLDVYREGTDSAGTKARMWEVAQTLELAVAENPRLGNLVMRAIVSDFRTTTTAGDDGVLANYTFGVSVIARV
jgi:hypothetical protein